MSDEKEETAEERIRRRLKEVAGELASAEVDAGHRAAGMAYPPTFSKAQRWVAAAVMAEEAERLDLKAERHAAEAEVRVLAAVREALGG